MIEAGKKKGIAGALKPQEQRHFAMHRFGSGYRPSIATDTIKTNGLCNYGTMPCSGRTNLHKNGFCELSSFKDTHYQKKIYIYIYIYICDYTNLSGVCYI
jgi:hypothetical protein